MSGYVSEDEAERLLAERLAQVGPVKPTRFVPRSLELRMGRAAAEAWLNAKDAESIREGDADVLSRMLGI